MAETLQPVLEVTESRSKQLIGNLILRQMTPMTHENSPGTLYESRKSSERPITQRRRGSAASESFSNKAGLEEHIEQNLGQETGAERMYPEEKEASVQKRKKLVFVGCCKTHRVAKYVSHSEKLKLRRAEMGLQAGYSQR